MVLVSNTVDDCLQRQIAQKIFKLKIEALPVNTGHYMAFKYCISFATNLGHHLAANFWCYWFRIRPDSDIVPKLLCAAIWSCCAVQFESEQNPFPQTSHWLESTALHRMQLGTCCFVPVSYFYSETNEIEWMIERSLDWVKQWALLWSATTACQFHGKFHFKWKEKWLTLPDIYKALKSFWLMNCISIARASEW